MTEAAKALLIDLAYAPADAWDLSIFADAVDECEVPGYIAPEIVYHEDAPTHMYYHITQAGREALAAS